MNSITKKILLVSLVLLLNACAHNPRQYAYYPDAGSYGSGYTVMQRNYYGGTSGHYDNGYGWDKGNFPPRHHSQYNLPPRDNHDYLRSQYQHDRRDDHEHRQQDNRSNNNWDGHNFNHHGGNENNPQYGNHDDDHHRRGHHQRFNDFR